MWETHGYCIQRRCPHLKADLTRFATIEDGVLTCTLNGWQFEMETGRCLTSDGWWLFAHKIDDSTGASASADAPAHEPETKQVPGAMILDKCHECWYRPSDLSSAVAKSSRPADDTSSAGACRDHTQPR